MICWRDTTDGVLYTRPHRLSSGWEFEFSYPPSGELFVGTLLEPGAERMVGHLTALELATATEGGDH